MAIGRISGPLLKANLLRQGVDLAFETDLLYLNVNDARIGVNTASPDVDLDVNGTTRTTNLIVDTQLDVGVLTFVGNSISSATNQINFLSPTGNEATIYHAKLIVDDFQITGNTISTEVSNSPIEIRPSGTGTVELQADTNITGDLFVSGKIDADGNVTIGGNIIIGDDIFEDTIEVNAKIASNLVPNEDQVYDIGTPTKRWRNVYISNLEVSSTLDIGNFSFEGNTISTSSTSIIFDTPEGESVIFNSKIIIDDIQIAGNVISTEVSNSPLELRPSGTGTIELQSDTNVTGSLDVSNDLTVGNDATINGNLTIGTDSNDIVTINSSLSGDLIPSSDITYNIGSTDYRWKDLYANTFTITTELNLGDLNFVNSTISTTENSIIFDTPEGEAVVFNTIIRVDDLQFSGNVISTEVSNSSIEIRPSGTGTIELQASTDVTGNLTITNDLLIEGNFTVDGDITLGTDSSNTIVVNSKLQGDLLPSVDNTYDIGSTDYRWKDLYADSLIISTTLDVGDLNFVNSTFSTTENSIVFDTPEGEAVIFNTIIRVDDIQIAGNVISTEVSNSNLEIRPNGTGTIELQSNTNIDGDLTVTNDITVEGNLTVDGNITLGTDSNNIVEINSKLQGNLLPSIDNTYDIGSPTLRWADLYANNFYITTELDVGDINFTNNVISTTSSSITFTTPNSEATVFNSKIVVDDIQIQGNVISTEVSNSNLDLDPNGTGKVKLKADTEIDGDLHVTGNISAAGNITIGGNIIIGDESTDTITINASIQSDLIPAEDVTYAIGNPSFRWKDIHVQTLNASFINVTELQIGNLQFSGNTVSSDTGVDINLNAGGVVNLGNFRINQNNITNIVSGAISVFEQIGDGYFKIATTNGFVPPVGNVANRPTAYAVVGMTRYNTDTNALEIWNGSTWTSPAGPLSGITEALANDIAASFALILG
jgi:cytoskeletal protein CcmA (bactofilin family)